MRSPWSVEVSAPQIDESRAFYRSRPPGSGPATPEQLHAVRARRSALATADPPAIEETVEAGGRSVPVRITVPAAGPPRGVHLDVHGGGFYLDSAASGDVRNRRLADERGLVVVSVDYRLAPEYPWPAAPDDCETAARWLLNEAGTRFGTSHLVIGGSSAGATLAATTLLRLRDRGVVEGFREADPVLTLPGPTRPTVSA